MKKNVEKVIKGLAFIGICYVGGYIIGASATYGMKMIAKQRNKSNSEEEM